MKNSILKILKECALLIFFCGAALAIPFKIWEELQLFSLIEQSPTIISERGTVPPLIFAIPIFLTIALGLFISLRSGSLTAEQSNKGIKFILRIIPFVIPSLIIYPLAVNNYIKEKGYSYCPSYTYSSAISADVWLSDPSYCISKGSVVQSSISKWMLHEQSIGGTFTPEKIEAKIDEFTDQLYNPGK